MSNKPKNFKSSILQLGSFYVTRETGGEHDWVSIKAKDGGWTLRYRDDNFIYGQILQLVRDPEGHDLLRSFINMNYMLSNVLPDGEFVKGFFEVYQAYVVRMVAKKSIPTEKEEDDALKEMEALHELQSELTELTMAANANEGTGD